MADELLQQLMKVLEDRPEGIPEHILLKHLQADNPGSFPASVFRDDLALFRAHFLLFNALYRLRERLSAEGRYGLVIDARSICLLPLAAADAASLTDPDSMRDYYLDMSNLAETTAADLEQMLGDFWVRYFANDQRGPALAELGLAPDADQDAVQRRYRELAMQHHPDRGGDVERFQKIQAAMAVLKRC